MKLRRFELLLRTFHLINNEECPTGDRFFKIQGLIDLLVSKYNLAYISEEDRYNIKAFKLCIKDAYTIGFRLYTGKEATPGQEISTKLVTEMTHEFLNFGRTVYTDNWYTSVNLQHKLFVNNTHLVGTLSNNRKQNPKDVTSKKFKKRFYSTAVLVVL